MENETTRMDEIIAEVIQNNERRRLEEKVVPELNEVALFNSLTMNTAVNT